jgi:hypothetical protein
MVAFGNLSATAFSRVRRSRWQCCLTLWAKSAGGSAAYADGSSSPSSLSWIRVEDSHGVSIWQYEMSLDRGGVTDPGKFIWSFFLDLCWQLYRGYIAIACWLVDWTLSFDWVGWVADPVMGLGDGLQRMVDRFGLTTTLLTITACVAVLWMARGRWVLGLFELFMALIITSLAVGVLANPVRLVAGDGGLLMDSRDAGLSVAAGLNNQGDTSGSPAHLHTEVTGMIADTFLRQPQQMVNFGKVLDGTRCETVYQDTVEDGPYGDDPDLRDAVGGCDETAGETAENPNGSMFMSLAVLLPAGVIAIGFSVLLCGVVLVAGVYALYQSLKMIVALVMAMLPGGARGSLWMTFAELVISMVTIIFSVVFLTAYLLLIQSVFGAGENSMKTFFVVDLMLLVGMVVFWKGRQRIKAATERLAQAMAKRPGGGGATRLPGKTRTNFADTYYKGKLALHGARVAGRGAGTVGRAAGTAATGAGRAAYAPLGTATSRIGFAAAAAGGRGRGAGSQASPADRVRERVGTPSQPSRRGKLVRLAGTAAMAAATGGASAAAGTVTTGVGRHAAVAATRRHALEGRLRPRLPAGPGSSTGGGSPGAGGPAPGLGGTAGDSTTGAAAGSRLPAGSGRQHAPIVVQGRVVSSRVEDPEPRPRGEVAAARLRARLAQRRTPIALPPAAPRPQGR